MDINNMNPTASPTENTPAHGYGLLVRTPESKLQDIEKSEQNRQKAIEVSIHAPA